MTDYSEIHDHVINCKVAQITGDSAPVVEEWGVSRRVPDYCNDASYAWPIIAGNSIVLMPSMRVEKSGLWLCFDVNNSDCDCQDENPLRAAMIVFLMMTETEQCSS